MAKNNNNKTTKEEFVKKAKNLPANRDEKGFLTLKGKALIDHLNELVIKNKITPSLTLRSATAPYRVTKELLADELDPEWDLDQEILDSLNPDDDRTHWSRRSSPILVFGIQNTKGFIEGETYVPLSCEEKLVGKYWDIRKIANDLNVFYDVIAGNLNMGTSPFWSTKLRCWVDCRDEELWNGWLAGHQKEQAYSFQKKMLENQESS